MTKTITSVFLASMFLLSGALLAQNETAEAEAVEEAEEDLTFDREGERCISTRSIRNTDIIDDRTILFEMRGGEFFVNNLSFECRGLRRAGSFSYRSTAGRLCDVDAIRVVEQIGGSIREGIGCGLGLFYPITEEEAEFVAVEADERRGRPQIQVENPNALDEDEENDQ